MLHCCHVRHHGDKDYTDGLIFLNNGVVSLYTKQTQVKPIILRRNDEAGTEIKATDEAFWNANPNGLAVGEVGLRGGQHSGVEDCIMRYDNAGAFLSADEGTVYIFEQTIDRDLHFKPNMWMNELTGLGLCDSKDGTGVNSSDASPRCRYGDATVGNCKSQVCINDKFD